MYALTSPRTMINRSILPTSDFHHCQRLSTISKQPSLITQNSPSVRPFTSHHYQKIHQLTTQPIHIYSCRIRTIETCACLYVDTHYVTFLPCAVAVSSSPAVLGHSVRGTNSCGYKRPHNSQVARTAGSVVPTIAGTINAS